MTVSRRLQEESGFGLIELLVALIVLTVALLALAAGFETAAVSVRNAGLKTTATTLANAQIELYRALQYSAVGLDTTTLTNVKTSGNGAYDSTYVADENALNAVSSGTDVTISGCGATAKCLPVQTVTASDGHTYKLETFIRDVVASTPRTERIVTVIVRDPAVSGAPELIRLTTAFDSAG